MLTLNLSRHGATEGNLRRAYVGSTDLPLCDEGREDLARVAGDYPPVEQVFCSPMLRCTQTAELLYPGQPVQLVEELRERDFGDFENLNHEDIIALPGHSGWGMTAKGMQFPGGEDRLEFFARCAVGFWGAVDKAVEDGVTRAAIVTHGGVIMTVMRDFCQPRKLFHEWSSPNGGGYLLSCRPDSRQLTVVRRLGQ